MKNTQIATVLYLTFFASLATAAAKEQATKQTALSAMQFSLDTPPENALLGARTCPAYFFSEQLEQNSCPVINKQFISQFIIASPQAIQTMCDLIESIMASSDKLEACMRLVFTHLKDFRIISAPLDKIEKFAGSYTQAFYASTVATMVIPNEIEEIQKNSEQFYSFRAAFRHEFMHALMNTMHRRDRPSSIATTPYFPANDFAEEEKVTGMIKIGDERINKLKELLDLETSGKILYKDKKYLDQLRAASISSYLKDYKTYLLRTVRKKDLPLIEKSLGKKLQGATMNLDRIFEGMHYGDITVEVANQHNPNTPNDSISILFSFRDPLHAAAYQILELHKPQISKEYSKAEYLAERTAYLWGDIPLNLLARFYPEFIAYIDTLTKQESDMPTPYYKPAPDYTDFHMLKLDHIICILKQTEVFDAALAPNYINWAKYVVQNGEIQAAKTGLTTLISKGFYVEEANEALARIYYDQEKDYKSAAIYFKRAEEHGHKLSLESRIRYSDALGKSGLFKDAHKQENKAWRQVSQGMQRHHHHHKI